MTVGTLPSSTRSGSRASHAAGWWLSAAGRAAPADVCALVPEPGRPSLVIDADGPDERTDRLLGELSHVLYSAGVSAVRLVLSSAADRYARTSSCAPGIDLIAADGTVVITPHGYALVRPTGPVTDGALPQWYRRLPGGGCEAAGALAPSPEWERGMADVVAAEQGNLRLRRVPAGLALAQPGRDAWLALAAQQVWPDPERPTIVIDGTMPREVIHDDLAGLLAPLALHSPGGIRLHWPRAAVAGSGPALQELAGELGVDLIVPAADVSACEFGGMCHGPSGAAPWLRLGRDGSVSILGSLYPEPAWERALAEEALAELPADLVVEDVAAGLCVYRPGSSQRGLSATARSILPDPARLTIVAGGGAGAVQQDVAAVLGRLPAKAAVSVRLLLAGAASGGEDLYAQDLADVFDCEIVAPAGRWTATPDGRVRALAAPGAATGAEARGWRTFLPRRAADGQPQRTEDAELPLAAHAETGDAAAAETALAEPVQAKATQSGQGASVPAAPGGITMLSRDHRSTAAERMAYRESAPEFHAHSVSVRRMMTQQPGLRSIAAGEAMEAVATDFTAVLDFLNDDREAAAAELRSRGTAGNPRVACVLSGLRRLPSFTGAVFSPARVPGGAVGGYAVGTVLIEPAFVEASSSHLVAWHGGVEYVIWSQTGKRMAALAAWAGRDKIIFAAGTSYRVLRVDPATSGARVFLRELAISGHPGDATLTASSADGSLDETDHKMLERLMQAATLRDGAAAGDQLLPWCPGAISPIGLDDHGLPFTLSGDLVK